MKAGAARKLTGAEQRALAQQFAEADPKAEAWAKESSFLGHLGSAQDDLDWIISHEAWTHLGHDTFSSWWDARAPRMHALGFQPTKQIALTVLARLRADDEKLPKAQRRTNRQLAASVGLSEASIRRTTPRSLPATDDAGADLEETQDSPAADSLPPQAHAGVPAVGGPTEERTEEQSGPWDVVWTSVGNDAEIDRQTFDSYQLALAEMERSRRAGSIAEVDVEPTPTDSPTGLEAAQPRDGRSETDHHDGAGVSLSGEALPVESRPAGALLEDGGTAQDPPSSSDPVVIRASVEDMIGTVERLEVPREEWDSWTPAQRRAHIDNFGAEVMNNCGGYGAGIESGAPVSDLEDEPLAEPTPTDRLLASVDALINLVDELDVEAVASMLFPAELEQLHQHSEALAAFVAKVSRIRFEALTRTP